MPAAPTHSSPAPAHTLSDPLAVSKTLFPDGLKTSGQHSPIYSRLRPYSDFPKETAGPTVWEAKDYANSPERWTHVFSDEEIDELSNASDDFMSSGTPLTGITRDLFHLPTLATFFRTVRNELINGKGFVLFKGVPVQEWGLEKCAVSGVPALLS